MPDLVPVVIQHPLSTLTDAEIDGARSTLPPNAPLSGSGWAQLARSRVIRLREGCVASRGDTGEVRRATAHTGASAPPKWYRPAGAPARG